MGSNNARNSQGILAEFSEEIPRHIPEEMFKGIPIVITAWWTSIRYAYSNFASKDFLKQPLEEVMKKSLKYFLQFLKQSQKNFRRIAQTNP